MGVCSRPIDNRKFYNSRPCLCLPIIQPVIIIYTCYNIYIGASLIAQLVKNPPAMQETPVQFLGQEDPLEKR